MSGRMNKLKNRRENLDFIFRRALQLTCTKFTRAFLLPFLIALLQKYPWALVKVLNPQNSSQQLYLGSVSLPHMEDVKAPQILYTLSTHTRRWSQRLLSTIKRYPRSTVVKESMSRDKMTLLFILQPKLCSTEKSYQGRGHNRHLR